MGTFMRLENKDFKEIIIVNEDEIPFDEDFKIEMIDFRCKKCGYEEPVPDFVAFECYIPEEFDRETGSPIVLCPKCDSDMIMKKLAPK